jgi:hypothetical protein
VPEIERPLDYRRVVKDTPPKHWTLLGKGKAVARLLIYEDFYGVQLDKTFLYKIHVTCEFPGCVKPEHLRCSALVPSEDQFLKEEHETP